MKTKFYNLKPGDFFVLKSEYDKRDMIPYMMIEESFGRDNNMPRYVNCLNGDVTCRSIGCTEEVYLLDPKFYIKQNILQTE